MTIIDKLSIVCLYISWDITLQRLLSEKLKSLDFFPMGCGIKPYDRYILFYPSNKSLLQGYKYDWIARDILHLQTFLWNEKKNILFLS